MQTEFAMLVILENGKTFVSYFDNKVDRDSEIQMMHHDKKAGMHYFEWYDNAGWQFVNLSHVEAALSFKPTTSKKESPVVTKIPKTLYAIGEPFSVNRTGKLGKT